MDYGCNLKDVGIGAARSCKPASAGTGSKLYLFDIDVCFPTKIPTPEKGIYYNWQELLHGVKDSGDPGLYGNLFGIKIKPNSGHPTGTRGEGSQMASQGFEVTVDKSVEGYAEIDAKIASMNVGLLLSDNAGNYYVGLCPTQELVYNSDFEGGQNYDDDHGITATFTYAPMYHLMNKVTVPAGENLDQFLDSKNSSSGSKVDVTIAEPTNGTVKVSSHSVDVASGDKVYKDSIVCIESTPAEGYRIDKVAVTVGSDTMIYTGDHVDVKATGAISIAVTFEAND